MKLATRKLDEENDDFLNRTYSAIQLSLADSVLREVANETSPTDLWLKLKILYMMKTLTNHLYLK